MKDLLDKIRAKAAFDLDDVSIKCLLSEVVGGREGAKYQHTKDMKIIEVLLCVIDLQNNFLIKSQESEHYENCAGGFHSDLCYDQRIILTDVENILKGLAGE